MEFAGQVNGRQEFAASKAAPGAAGCLVHAFTMATTYSLMELPHANFGMFAQMRIAISAFPLR